MRTSVVDQAKLLCMILNDGDMQPCGGDSGKFISPESAHQLRELQARERRVLVFKSQVSWPTVALISSVDRA